jgi:heme/copper-type cytochrome/quinol oxidase subunit 1
MQYLGFIGTDDAQFFFFLELYLDSACFGKNVIFRCALEKKRINKDYLDDDRFTQLLKNHALVLFFLFCIFFNTYLLLFT